MRVLLFLAYPLLSHLAVLMHRPWPQGLAMTCAYAAFFYAPLRGGSRAAWFGFALFCTVDILIIRLGDGAYALYLPSLVVPSLLFSKFAPSLLPGRVPLVTRIAEAMDSQLSRARIDYTRSVTWVWTVLLGLILLVTLSLLLWWSMEAWSVFANFISYGLIAALLVGEYGYRRLRFPQDTPLSFRAFLHSAMSYRPD